MFKTIANRLEQIRSNRIKVKYAIAALTDMASVVYWDGKSLEPTFSPANAATWDTESEAKSLLRTVASCWQDLSPRVVKVLQTNEER